MSKWFWDNVVVWLTTAPRGGYDLVNESISSLRDAWINNIIHVAAEPWSSTIMDDWVYIYENVWTLGAFQNFDNLLRILFYKAKQSWKEYIFLTQDDYYYHPQIKDVLDREIDDTWVYNLTTRPRQWRYFKHMFWEWFYEVNAWWQSQGVSYIMNIDIAEKILFEDEYYTYHLRNYEKNKHIDACVWYVCQQNNIPMYHYNPSLTVHIWKCSTLNHPMAYAWKAFFRYGNYILASMATIPERKEQMLNVVDTISPQVNVLSINLNWYESIPEELENHKYRHKLSINIRDNTYGDAEKLKDFIRFQKQWYESFYYFMVDDDLLYPDSYIRDFIQAIEKYNRERILGYHGIKINRERFHSYYDSRSRIVRMFSKEVDDDYAVDILWTWVIWFHEDIINNSQSYMEKISFNYKNMADIIFAIWTKRITKKVLKHNAWYIKQQHIEDSIYKQWSKDDKEQTDLVYFYYVKK